jgi:hypothetical protein
MRPRRACAWNSGASMCSRTSEPRRLRAKEQWEDEAVQRLTVFLAAIRHEAYGVVGRDVPVASGENFDFESESHAGGKLAADSGPLLPTVAHIGRVSVRVRPQSCRGISRGDRLTPPING